MRKKVDQRIRTLVENSVKLHQRSMFVIVGDRGRDQARPRPACALHAARPCAAGACCAARRAAAQCRGPQAAARRLR
jgi:hypothetical protein